LLLKNNSLPLKAGGGSICSLIGSLIICLGIMGYSVPIDYVAERRYNAEWGNLSYNPNNFDALLGLEDCKLIGKIGYLFMENDRFYRILVVDCKNSSHSWPSCHYLGDVNRKELNLKQGILVLKNERILEE
jgi:hypothetical protein